MKTTKILLTLGGSTGSCQFGPIFLHRPGELSVWYDQEGDESPEWFRITFQSAVALRFSPEPFVDETMVTAYSRILEIEHSEWLEEISSLAVKRHQQPMPGLHHMVLFFDHYGCLEILAKSVVEAKGGIPPTGG